MIFEDIALLEGSLRKIDKAVRRIAERSFNLYSNQACQMMEELFDRKEQLLNKLLKIYKIMTTLSVKEQLLVKMYYFDKIGAKEIAEEMKISERTVFRKIERIKEKF